jgi:predicted dehydrogenase
VSRVAIVGCGLIGDKRAHAALAAGCRIVSVADVDRPRAEQLARRLGSSAAVLTDYREVPSSAPDIVVIATPHDRLASIALAMTEAGHHVLVEKPAGRTAAEVEPILAAARRRNVLVKVGFNHRFHPAMLKARAIVDSGLLGPLLFVRGRYGHGGRVGYEQEWRMRPEISGGGELIDQGMHLIDLSRWFLGDFDDVYGVAPTYFWQSAVEDNCFLCLRTATGQVAWLHAGWTEWKNIFSFEIMGRDGKLQIDGLGGSYGLERLTHYRMLPQMGPPETTAWEFPFPDRSWELEFREFLSAIAERRQPLGNIADGKAALEIVDRVYGEKRP